MQPVTDVDLVIQRTDQSVEVGDLALKRSDPFVGTLAATQNYQSRQAATSEEFQARTTPVVNNFLPSPNRLVVLGGLGVVGALGLGAIASTFIPHSTTVNAQVAIEPAGEVQTVQASTAGSVETIFVQNYETLESNQTIASLDGTSLLTEISNIQATIAQTQEQIVQINSEIRALEQRRASQAHSRRSPFSASEIKLFEYSRGLLLNHQRGLNTQLEQQRAQLAQVEQGIDKLTVRTPTAGTLYGLELNYSGQTVSSNEVIAKVLPDGMALEIKAVVPDSKIKHIEVGHSTQIDLVNCGPGYNPLEGQVASIQPVAQTPSFSTTGDAIAQNTPKSYLVTVEAHSQDAGSNTCKLLPGKRGEVTIIARQEKLSDLFLRKLRLKTNV
ncbi:MAG: HlyD family efflux transporter periplasmic adaptor subunit [Cyanobacteria bacterium P01_A01_bin.137]